MSIAFSLHPSRHPSIRFQGQRATHLAQQTLLSDLEQYDKLKQALKSDDTPYLGQLPPEFKLSGLLSQQQALQALDGLTKRLWLYQKYIKGDTSGFPIKSAGAVSFSSRF